MLKTTVGHSDDIETEGAAYRFLIKLGTVAHDYGVSSCRLESFLARVAQAMGLQGEFFVTPGYIHFIVQQPGEAQQHSHLARMVGSTFDMAKVAQIGELVDQVEAGTLSMAEGTSRLEDLSKQAPIYGRWLVALGYAFSGSGFAVLLSAGWGDVLLSGILSMVVYGVALLASRSKWIAHSLELTSALVASLLANVAAILHPGLDPFIVSLCAVIVLIPGLSLTLGLAELSAKHVISGTHRLIDGVLITLKLFIGAAIGSWIINALETVPAALVPPAIPAVWTWMFAAVLVAGLALTFQVRPKDFAWAVLGGVLVHAGTVIGGHFGFWQGSFIGALGLAVYANLYASCLRRPASIVMLTAIMVLVPGSSAYRGLQAAETGGLMSGLSAEWHVFLNIFAIIAGLLVAYTLVPRKAGL